MFRVQRTEPAPDSLAIEAKKQDGSYRQDDVLQVLRAIFYGKCYLCEDRADSSLPIDHLKSKSKYPELEYDWGNLFLICGRCNNKKQSEDYRDISLLDCTSDQHMVDHILITHCDDGIINSHVDAQIKFVPHDDHREHIALHQLEDIINNTASLLDRIFNAPKSKSKHGLKKLFSEQANALREALEKEMQFFNKALLDYNTATLQNYDTVDQYLTKVVEEIQPKSLFSSFKRYYLQHYFTWLYEDVVNIK